MNILNNKQVDTFLWEHRENGCKAIRGGLLDEYDLPVNTAFEDMKTGERIEIIYVCKHGKGITDYCLDCGRVNSTE